MPVVPFRSLMTASASRRARCDLGHRPRAEAWSTPLPAERSLSALYRGYIACLNAQDWSSLGEFVAEDVEHNGRALGLSGYGEMLVQDYLDIPDLHFRIGMLVCDPHCVAARLQFDCRPRGEFLGLKVDGRRVSFAENVFYEYEHGRIRRVWSVIDKAAIEAQLESDRRAR